MDANEQKKSKVPFCLIPKRALAQVALAMQVGAEKYGAYDFREKPAKSMVAYLSALQRHIAKVEDGVDFELVREEEGTVYAHVSHLAFVAAGALVMLDALEHNNLVDDRSPSGKPDAFWIGADETSQIIHQVLGDKDDEL